MLRLEYERSLRPIQSEEENQNTNNKIPLKEKIQYIKAIEAGLPFSQTPIEFGYSFSSVRSWYRAKDGLMALYYIREGSTDQEDSAKAKDCVSSDAAFLEGALMSEDPKDTNLAETIRAQRKEIEYLKHKVAYLESLNEILKDRHGTVKKRTV